MPFPLVPAGIAVAAATVVGVALVPAKVLGPAEPAGSAIAVATSASPAPGRSAQAERYTACMRSHGVPDFPGLTIIEDGRLLLGLGGKVDPISAAYRSAARACARLLPDGAVLPSVPQPPKPPAPRPGFTCTGDGCPVAPTPPAEPG